MALTKVTYSLINGTYSNVLDFGADPTGVADSTAAIQAALDTGASILMPGKFRITTGLTITKPGTRLFGRKWSTVVGTDDVTSDSDQLIWEGVGSCISVAPVAPATDIERIYLSDFAITGNANNGIYVANCRHSEFRSIYMTDMVNCWNFGGTNWQNIISHCQGFSYTGNGLYMDSGSEDSLIESCLFRGYGAASVGLYINYYAATLTVVNCDFSDNKVNVRINPGLATVDGVYTFTGCQFEGGTGSGAANHIGVDLTVSSEGSVVIFDGCRWTHTDAATRASAKSILINSAASVIVRGARVTNVGTFIDVPTASNVDRLEVTDVVGDSVTTAFANQSLSVANLTINNVLAQANNAPIYSTGTFTPVVFGTTTDGVGTYSTQLGKWTKIGNVVYFSIELDWSAHTGTGDMQVRFLPFASAASGAQSAVTVFNSNISMTAGNVMEAFVFTNTQDLRFRQVPSGGGTAVAIPLDTAGSLICSGFYFV